MELKVTKREDKGALTVVLLGEAQVNEEGRERQRGALLRALAERWEEWCPRPKSSLLLAPLMEVRPDKERGDGYWQFALHYHFLPDIQLPDYPKVAREVNQVWHSFFSQEDDREIAAFVHEALRRLEALQTQQAGADSSRASIQEGTTVQREALIAQAMNIAKQEAALFKEESYERALGQALLDATPPFEAPRLLVEYETDLLLRSFLLHLPMLQVLPHMTGFPPLEDVANLSEEELQRRFEEEANWRVRFKLLLYRIAEEEEITATEEEVRAFAASLWSQQPTQHHWESLKAVLQEAVLMAKTIARLKKF